jgi:selenocysteine lyase/cysteine desulfurase
MFGGNMIETWRPVLVPGQARAPSFREQYDSTAALDRLRAGEYAYLDRTDHVYLDYAGAGLPAAAQLRVHAERLRGGCFGDPHADGPAALESRRLIDQARDTVLAFLGADPDEYAVIFTANATGACRLVGEAYGFGPGSRLLLTADNHNSVNGIREYARRAGGKVGYIPLRPREMRVHDGDLMRALRRGERVNPVRWAESAGLKVPARRGLLAYPAQSNFTGVQHPLEWIELAHQHGYDVLLDAAAYLATNVLDLAAVHPDFVAVSWHKVFGYPTGAGCLVARHEALEALRRPWFAGGSVQAAGVRADWALLSGDEAAFEDGTPNFLAIPDVEAGISWVSEIGMDVIHRRVTCLTAYLLDRLRSLRHADERPLVRLHGPLSTRMRGGTVAFNVLDPYGDVVDERIVGRDAAAAGISVRTGWFCNPGAGETAFGLDRRQVASAVRQRPATADEYLGLLGPPTAGAVRVSLGLVSTLRDIERFTEFVERTYANRLPDLGGLEPRLRC